MQVLNGFVKIHRKLLQWGWYQDNVVKGVFIHLLLTAAFRDTTWRNMEIKRGQVVTSYKNLSNDLGFSVQQIRTAISKLISTGEITRTSTNRNIILTVENWEDYQSNDEISTSKATQSATFNQQAINKQTTSNQQANNIQITSNQQHRKNKRIKEIKNKRSVCDISAHTPDLQSEKISFAEFVTMTNAEYDALIEKYGEADTKRMIEILDDYKGSTGKTYESDYRTILSWVWDRLRKEKQNGPIEPEYLHRDNFNHSELEGLTRRKDL